MSIQEKFGSKVRYYRLFRKYSQEDLALKTGLHRTYISELERGQRNITLENINKLSKSLNIRIIDLFDFEM
ncbi:helix-turn-helix domain-containing protein [Anaerobacillus sp. 1_MG-2023]|uniref:helix-turn-helix domain-containing protein n=1 Tax=Anaerobacillus sp. 1_MG-2023 TaxID=3062655 RepID=UPI0026E2A5F7|nr:helix-turn-helix transcriptional regulator [Anaerobacillus sp. 1_MG-2023]MDO6657432.1 helix-turn-helix transcriptional regulator [Anaerobacillus sp. 1_MG-2023]